MKALYNDVVKIVDIYLQCIKTITREMNVPLFY